MKLSVVGINIKWHMGICVMCDSIIVDNNLIIFNKIYCVSQCD